MKINIVNLKHVQANQGIRINSFIEAQIENNDEHANPTEVISQLLDDQLILQESLRNLYDLLDKHTAFRTFDNFTYRVALESIAYISLGSTPQGASYVTPETGIPFFRSQNVLRKRFTEKGLVYIAPAQDKRKLQVQTGDILLTLTGASSLGRACCAPERYLPAHVNQHIAVIRPHEIRLSRFLMHWFNSSKAQQTLNQLVYGTTRPALSLNQLKQLQVPFPDTQEEQEALKDLEEILAETDQVEKIIAELTAKAFMLKDSVIL